MVAPRLVHDFVHRSSYREKVMTKHGDSDGGVNGIGVVGGNNGPAAQREGRREG